MLRWRGRAPRASKRTKLDTELPAATRRYPQRRVEGKSAALRASGRRGRRSDRPDAAARSPGAGGQPTSAGAGATPCGRRFGLAGLNIPNFGAAADAAVAGAPQWPEDPRASASRRAGACPSRPKSSPSRGDHNIVIELHTGAHGGRGDRKSSRRTGRSPAAGAAAGIVGSSRYCDRIARLRAWAARRSGLQSPHGPQPRNGRCGRNRRLLKIL